MIEQLDIDTLTEGVRVHRIPYPTSPRTVLAGVLEKKRQAGRRIAKFELASLPEDQAGSDTLPEEYTRYCEIRTVLIPEEKLKRWKLHLGFHAGGPFHNLPLRGWKNNEGPRIIGDLLVLVGSLAEAMPDTFPFTASDEAEFAGSDAASTET